MKKLYFSGTVRTMASPAVAEAVLTENGKTAALASQIRCVLRRSDSPGFPNLRCQVRPTLGVNPFAAVIRGDLVQQGCQVRAAVGFRSEPVAVFP